MAQSSLHDRVWECPEAFLPFCRRDSGGGLRFTYRMEATPYASEYLGVERHRIPSTYGLWQACTTLPRAVRHCYLGNSAVTLIRFLDSRGIDLHSAAAVSMGLLPTKSQLATIRGEYTNAKIHCLFGDNPIGRITSCLVALWSSGRDGAFRLLPASVHYRLGSKTGELPLEHFSLHRFEQTIGLRSGVRTHRPV